MSKRIVITGGHHNSALVVAEALRKKGFEVIWFGRQTPRAEYREVVQSGFKFVEIKAGKSHRWWQPANLWRLPWGFCQARRQLRRYRPDLVLSFGGYLAVPVVLIGWLMGIPAVTHEQTVVYGLANRLIARFAKKIMVSWPQSVKHFPAQKVVLTGLPLRPEILTPTTTPRRSPAVAGHRPRSHLPFRSPKNHLTIYITGGKQGARVINQAVKQILPDLLEKYQIIHQCGDRDWPEFKKIKKPHYLVQPYFFRDQIGQIFRQADLIVSRAGAHTTYEIAALGKPALFIPIPWSHADEQTQNAQLLAKVGLAEALSQDKLTAQSLKQKIEFMIIHLNRYQKNAAAAKKLVIPRATEKIVDLISRFCR